MTPLDFVDIDERDLLRGTFYNPTGLVVGSTLHLYAQGGMLGDDPVPPWIDCDGDEIIRFSTPATAAGVRSRFVAGNRISPCNPDDVGTHYGLGTIVKAPWDLQYKIFLDRTENGSVLSEGDFKEVLIGTSSDGINFSYPEAINPLIKQSIGISILDLTLISDGRMLWGVFRFGETSASRPWQKGFCRRERTRFPAVGSA